MDVAGLEEDGRLRDLLDRAVEDFGPRCLWNVPAELPLRARAKIVYDQISKYGGVEGMRRAVEIRDQLAALGDRPWR